jgi:hypothetical protein
MYFKSLDMNSHKNNIVEVIRPEEKESFYKRHSAYIWTMIIFIMLVIAAITTT